MVKGPNSQRKNASRPSRPLLKIVVDTFCSEPVGPLGPGVGHGGGGGLAGDRGQGRRGPAVGLHPAAVAPRPGHGGTQVPGGCRSCNVYPPIKTDALSDHVCQPQIPRGHHRVQRLREIGQNMERGGNKRYKCVEDCVVTCPVHV